MVRALLCVWAEVVWKGSTEVGCAAKLDCDNMWPGLGKIRNSVVVCRYNPPGNYRGEYTAQVGSPLSAAPSSAAEEQPTDSSAITAASSSSSAPPAVLTPALQVAEAAWCSQARTNGWCTLHAAQRECKLSCAVA